MLFNTQFVSILFGISLLDAAVVVNQKVEDHFKSNKLTPFLVQLSTPKFTKIPSNDLNSRAGNVRVNILTDELKGHSKQSQNNLLKVIEQLKVNGEISYYQSYYISNTIAVTGTKKALDKIKTFEKDIVEISSNIPFQIKPEPETNSRAIYAWDGKQPHWSLPFINATNLPKEVSENAKKLLFANVDTGVDFKHVALNSNYAGNLGNNQYNHNHNWWDANKVARPGSPNAKCGVNAQAPCDDNSHGSHTTSTAVGGVNLGVSPTTKWIACKNMDQGLGSPETYLGCLQFILAPTDLKGQNADPSKRPHVVGNSYGCPPDEGCSRTTFNNALKALKEAGIFMSVSAGNDGPSCSTINAPPALDINSFTVAASGYKTLSRASYSSVGPVPERPNFAIDVTAPGSQVMGALPGGSYGEKSGTSMASPHVAGAALLVMAGCPHLERNVEAVSTVLRNTATAKTSTKKCGKDTTTSIPNNEYGYGIINVAKALQYCKTFKL